MRLLCCLVAFTFKADSHIIYMQVIIGQAAVQRCNANVNFHDEEKPLYPPTRCRGAPLHSPYLVINEDGLPYGATLHASLATSYLTNYQQDIARVWFTVLIITGDYAVCT